MLSRGSRTSLIKGFFRSAPQFKVARTRVATLNLPRFGHVETPQVPIEIKYGFKFREGRRVFSRADVAKHNSTTDGWLIMHDKVYNVTEWLPYAPCGESKIEPFLGKDATRAYHGIAHSHQAREELEKLFIGYVEEAKRYTADEYHTLPIEFGAEGGFH